MSEPSHSVFSGHLQIIAGECTRGFSAESRPSVKNIEAEVGMHLKLRSIGDRAEKSNTSVGRLVRNVKSLRRLSDSL